MYRGGYRGGFNGPPAMRRFLTFARFKVTCVQMVRLAMHITARTAMAARRVTPDVHQTLVVLAMASMRLAMATTDPVQVTLVLNTITTTRNRRG
jgi:hypothetical protein